MGLSNKIVSKFVKATKNDTSNNKKEKIVYGNIVTKTENGKLVYYAKVDGADENTLIPISRLASGINDDQKVIIMIKDHTAIVTGNLDDPSVNNTQANEIVDSAISPIDLEDIEALWDLNGDDDSDDDITSLLTAYY